MGAEGGGEGGRSFKQSPAPGRYGSRQEKARVAAGQQDMPERLQSGVAITPGAYNAMTTPRSALANIMGLSDASRQRNLNASYELAHGTPREGNEDAHLAAVAREDAKKKAEEEAAAAASTTTTDTTATDTTASTTATDTTTAATTTTSAATDYTKMLTDMQATYDKQLAAFQATMDEATQGQADQLTALTAAMEEKKKKISAKKKKKTGRLSLLFASELGIPKVTTLGG